MASVTLSRTARTLITGGLDQIGQELARINTRAGRRLTLVDRSEEGLLALREVLLQDGAPHPLIISEDLCAPGAADDVYEACQFYRLMGPEGTAITRMINLLEVPAESAAGEDPAEQFTARTSTLLGLCQRFVPDLIRRGEARMLNILVAYGPRQEPFSSLFDQARTLLLDLSHRLNLQGSDRLTVNTLCYHADSLFIQAPAAPDEAPPDLYPPACTPAAIARWAHQVMA
jgi:hypothetical protein